MDMAHSANGASEVFLRKSGYVGEPSPVTTNHSVKIKQHLAVTALATRLRAESASVRNAFELRHHGTSREIHPHFPFRERRSNLQNGGS